MSSLENPVVIEITRGPMFESIHRGAYAVVNVQQDVISSEGDIDRPIYPRSAVKPLQALALVETGAADRWKLSDSELALACASHSAEPRHVETIVKWLARSGLTERDLECGPHPPSSEQARNELIRQNVKWRRIHHNCSGKHTGFLTTAVHLDEPITGYLAPEHPVQQRIKRVLAEITSGNLADAPIGVDGCGAPVIGMPLRHLAVAMARYGAAEQLPDKRVQAVQRLYRAMVCHPFMLAGTGRWCTRAMEAAAGQFAVKGGAEGVYCAMVPARRLGIALKIDDGASRAAEALMGLLLTRYAGLDPELSEKIRKLALPKILNAVGEKVGETRPAISP